jgi:hypothetical protein
LSSVVVAGVVVVVVIVVMKYIVNFRSRDSSGLHFIGNVTYSYECPLPYRLGEHGSCETGIKIGDLLDSELSGTSIVLSFGIAVLGSWTSLILVEQAIFHHLAKLVTWPWLLLSSLSLGWFQFVCLFYLVAEYMFYYDLMCWYDIR